ncbi:hypothetical protein BGW36DRAFT_433027 [Talaromyces proteolyticus]|uniref:F-box domain-containing protein n=1 Tax=Talaromyces proteolyticus TaxID=1131652 RepID=A0AAD4PT23_9EURO|nr:uncharacterized protein BGW36DRAFT_433027 [Talaromyces proteolyticus]KAH8690069.1 hypothetical protein BGW36DRAFT_433027 [Talaromyces proteolyticus]
MRSGPPVSCIKHSHLLLIPIELLAAIFALLPNRDIKNARLTCRGLCNAVHLRLDRVFISANIRNIEVLKAIADDETFRRGVVEIVWDDSLLPITRDPDDYSDRSPVWFRHKLGDNLGNILNERVVPDDPDLPIHVAKTQHAAALIPTKEAWSYYQTLVQQQKTVLASGADVSVLRYALEQFPSLRRITVTPAAHRVLFHPLYQAPMIRDFPQELNYLIQYGWLATKSAYYHPMAPPPGAPNEGRLDPWRGFRIVMRLLVELPHLRDLAALLLQLGFRRIDPALIVDSDWYDDWVPFRSGNLGRMLANAQDLEHVALSTTVGPDPAVDAEDGGDGHIRNFIPLKSIFPLDRWPRLRHLALFRFLVNQGDMIGLLVALPETLRYVELSFLLFLEQGGNYRDMLVEMREKLAYWKDDMDGSGGWGIPLRDGKNPFGTGQGGNKNKIEYGFGVVKDVFESEYERPFMDRHTMMELGYYK